MSKDDKAVDNEFIQIYRKLYPECQESVFWFVEHFDFIEKIVKEESISCDKLEERIEYAKKQEEHTLFIILLFKKSLSG